MVFRAPPDPRQSTAKLTEGWPGLDTAPDGPPSKPQERPPAPFPSIPNRVPSSARFSAGNSHICFCHLLPAHSTVLSCLQAGPCSAHLEQTSQIYILKLSFEATHLLLQTICESHLNKASRLHDPAPAVTGFLGHRFPCVDSAPALKETTHSTHCSSNAGPSSELLLLVSES